MMNREEFIQDFSRLGVLLCRYLTGEMLLPEWEAAKQKSVQSNPWFTSYHIDEALAAIAGNYLQKEKLEAWLAPYSDVWYGYEKDVTVVMAGNIPLVGYHDYLAVLASGRTVSVKLSSKDAFLLPALHNLLCSFAPAWRARLRYVAEVPADTNGLIATGSNATAAWFSGQYPHLPKIVRGHRNSVAVISHGITHEQVAALHRDMFCYFGLGCRSVVRLFIPEGFDITRLLGSGEALPQEACHEGFHHAYLHQKALAVLQGRFFVDGSYFLLQPSEQFCPPVATVYYTYYKKIKELENYLEQISSRLQCVVAEDADIKKCINFGTAQLPRLCDYADGVDIMRL